MLSISSFLFCSFYSFVSSRTTDFYLLFFKNTLCYLLGKLYLINNYFKMFLSIFYPLSLFQVVLNLFIKLQQSSHSIFIKTLKHILILKDLTALNQTTFINTTYFMLFILSSFLTKYYLFHYTCNACFLLGLYFCHAYHIT